MSFSAKRVFLRQTNSWIVYELMKLSRWSTDMGQVFPPSILPHDRAGTGHCNWEKNETCRGFPEAAKGIEKITHSIRIPWKEHLKGCTHDLFTTSLQISWIITHWTSLLHQPWEPFNISAKESVLTLPLHICSLAIWTMHWSNSKYRITGKVQ